MNKHVISESSDSISSPFSVKLQSAPKSLMWERAGTAGCCVNVTGYYLHSALTQALVTCYPFHSIRAICLLACPGPQPPQLPASPPNGEP